MSHERSDIAGAESFHSLECNNLESKFELLINLKAAKARSEAAGFVSVWVTGTRKAARAALRARGRGGRKKPRRSGASSGQSPLQACWAGEPPRLRKQYTNARAAGFVSRGVRKAARAALRGGGDSEKKPRRSGASCGHVAGLLGRGEPPRGPSKPATSTRGGPDLFRGASAKRPGRRCEGVGIVRKSLTRLTGVGTKWT